jgi:hypothetical protein
VSKEERRRRQKEEADEELKQAVADIGWLRENGSQCRWRPEEEFKGRTMREHVEFVVDDTRTNEGANAFVEERYLRMNQGERIARLAALDKTTASRRKILREAFKMADTKGAAYEL